MDQPRGVREAVRVGRVIVVIVRQSEVGNIGRFVADLRQLPFQRRLHCRARLDGSFRLDQFIGNDAGIPKQRAFRMDDEIRRYGHVRRRDPAVQQHLRISAFEMPAIEDVQLH